MSEIGSLQFRRCKSKRPIQGVHQNRPTGADDDRAERKDDMITMRIMEKVATEVEKRMSGVTCTVMERVKNNGVRVTGISVRKAGSNIAPCIYLKEEGSIEDMVEQVVDTYRSAANSEEWKVQEYLESGLLTKEYVLKNVVFLVRNEEWNKDMLEQMPYFETLDLAVVYVVPIERATEGYAGLRVTNELMEAMEIEYDELKMAALINTRIYYGFDVVNMAEILEEYGTSATPEMPVYVCTCKNRINGATILLYPGCFKQLSDELGCDLYLIPSSVHEVLALPTIFNDAASLKEMCQQVNSTEVDEEDRLGDTIYRYRRDTGKIVIEC